MGVVFYVGVTVGYTWKPLTISPECMKMGLAARINSNSVSK